MQYSVMQYNLCAVYGSTYTLYLIDRLSSDYVYAKCVAVVDTEKRIVTVGDGHEKRWIGISEYKGTWFDDPATGGDKSKLVGRYVVWMKNSYVWLTPTEQAAWRNG